MRILVLGGDGMLGHKLVQQLRKNYTVFTTLRSKDDRFKYALNFNLSDKLLFSNIDAYDFKTIASTFNIVKPDIVINCIGIVKQRSEAAKAINSIMINSLFPHQLADLCSSTGTKLIHFSTDCVFSGIKGNYDERDLPDPVDLYGRSKLLGELERSNCLTLRTSIIGWEIKNRESLLEWFASQRCKAISGYKNVIYSGLSTYTIGCLISKLIEEFPSLSGLFHVASESISKYHLLEMLRNRLGWNDIIIKEDESFICDRSLNYNLFESITGWQAPSWETMIRQLADEWPYYMEWRQVD